VKVGDAGPCAIVEMRWHATLSQSEMLWIFVGDGLSVSLVGTLLGVFLAIRPFVRRVANLRAAAGRVGDREGYAPADSAATDDLGQLSRELDRAHTRIRDDADRLERERSALQRHLADVAHDLRTPITSLQLALQHALATGADRAAIDEALSRALHDTVYVRGLTENLRLASRLEDAWSAGETALFDLRELVEHAAARAKFFAEHKGIALNVSTPVRPVSVRCHPTAIEQAIGNVVDNAVTHGAHGGHVAVLLRATGDRFVLTVTDDGPGIELAELPRLGERTFRTDEARQRDPRGSGLGLAITAEVCARSGWELAFERVEPHGLRVVFRGAMDAM
jgi:signal transduction histidine kinase